MIEIYKPKPPRERLLWTRQETAESLGISQRTLDRMREADRIPSVRVGGRVMFDPIDIRKWIDSQKELEVA